MPARRSAWLRGRYPDLPFRSAGFSFGSRVATRLGCDTGVRAHPMAAGFPTAHGVRPTIWQCAAPKIFVQSTQD